MQRRFGSKIKSLAKKYIAPNGSVRRYWLLLIIDAFRNPRRLVQEALVYQDYVGFRKDLGALLGAFDGMSNRRGVVLVVSLSDSIYSAKLEGMLATALGLRGLASVALIKKNSFWGKRYLRSFAISEFLYLEDFELSPDECRRIEHEVEQFMSRTLTFQEVKGWVFEGARVGQYALSSVSRHQHRGMPDLSNTETISQLREQLGRALGGLIRARKIFEQVHPDVCLFNEINYIDYGPVYAAAYERGLNIIQFVHALRDRALIFKRSTPETFRVHPNSITQDTYRQLLSAPWGKAHEEMLRNEFRDRYGGKWFLTRRDQRDKYIKSREEIVKALDLDPKKKTAVIYSHILWDANLFYGDDLFVDNEDWFVETVRVAKENKNVNWIVKLHPANMWKREWDNEDGELNEISAIKEKVGNLPQHVKILRPETDINTYSLFQVGDYGVTIRGTIGMELPCFGVPVLTAGTGRYSGFGFTIDSVSREEYLTRLRNMHKIPPLDDSQIQTAKKHAFAIFCLRPWVMSTFENSFREDKKGYYPLNPNLGVAKDLLNKRRKFLDLKKFSTWALDLSSLDYLEGWPNGPIEQGDSDLTDLNQTESATLSVNDGQ